MYFALLDINNKVMFIVMLISDLKFIFWFAYVFVAHSTFLLSIDILSPVSLCFWSRVDGCYLTLSHDDSTALLIVSIRR